MGKRFFFWGSLSSVASGMHHLPQHMPLGSSSSSWSPVTFCRLLHLFPNAKLNDLKLQLKFQRQRANRKLVHDTFSSALGKTTFGRYCSMRGIKKDAGGEQRLALHLLAKTGSDIISSNSVLYLSASSFSILLKSMRVLMSLYTSTYD